VLLGVFEIVFVFFRVIVRRIDTLTHDYLTVIPRDRLSRVLYKHLDSQRAGLLTRASRLAEHLACELEKHEMYGELIGLTEIVTEHYAGHHDGVIWAISSVNIEDFDDEPLADAYLEANRKAAIQRVKVCRLFLLEERQTKDRQVIALMKKHADALGGEDVTSDSGVKWLLRSTLDLSDQLQDFALFAGGALVSQNVGGALAELARDEIKISRATDVFERLWNRPDAHRVSELSPGRQ
jgi:hypothetical protein